MRAFMSIAVVLAASTPYAHAADLDIGECFVKSAQKFGAFVTCQDGRFRGYLGATDRGLAGYLICAKRLETCPDFDLIVAFDPTFDSGPQRAIQDGERINCLYADKGLFCMRIPPYAPPYQMKR